MFIHFRKLFGHNQRVTLKFTITHQSESSHSHDCPKFHQVTMLLGVELLSTSLRIEDTWALRKCRCSRCSMVMDYFTYKTGPLLRVNVDLVFPYMEDLGMESINMSHGKTHNFANGHGFHSEVNLPEGICLQLVSF